MRATLLRDMTATDLGRHEFGDARRVLMRAFREWVASCPSPSDVAREIEATRAMLARVRDEAF